MTPPLLRLAFRPFFFFGALFSLLAMGLWAAALNGQLAGDPYGGPLFWHGHEMLFGFVAAIIAGFLLTAVQNWTGIAGIGGAPLGGLLALWLAGRLAMLLAAPAALTIIVDCAFLPCVAWVLARPVLAVRQYRNLVFLPLLALMAAGNLLSHLGTLWHNPALALQGLHLASWLVLLLMTLIGGRVIAMFTANGTGTERVAPLPRLEVAVLASTLLVAAVQGSGLQEWLPDGLNAALLLLAAGCQAWRFARWRFWITARVPLLWSLHIAYAFIPLSLLLLGLHYLGADIGYATALHALLVGAIGNMILAMMARVSLGHTGRALASPRLMSLAFAALALAALARALLPWLWPAGQPLLLNGAALLWLLGYACFLVCYWPVLSRPRLDGRPG